MSQEKESDSNSTGALSPDLQEGAACEICLMPLLGDSLNTPCHTDKLCKPCWKQYLMTAVQEMSYRAGTAVKCPVCENSTIDTQFVMASLDQATSQTVGEKLLDVYLRQSNDVQRCPLSRCRFAYLPESCSVFKQSELQCPMCYTSLNRAFSLSLTPLITFIYITFMTNNCPKCEIPIDRVSGCYHMTCSCGHEFCWYCLKNYHNVDKSQYRQHNQNDCLFLLLTKILTTVLVMLSLTLVMSGSQTFSWALQGILSGLLVVVRALLTDGILVIEGIVLNKQRNYRTLKRNLVLFLLFDLVAGIILWMMGELAYTLLIIVLSLVVALSCIGVGLLVEFSVATWFNFIQ